MDRRNPLQSLAQGMNPQQNINFYVFQLNQIKFHQVIRLERRINVLKDFIGDTRLDLDLDSSDFKLISKTGNLINNGVNSPLP